MLAARTPPQKKPKAALLVNKTSVNEEFQYSWNILQSHYDIIRIFSPEHGLFATEQDQIAVTNQPQSNIDIVSLYGSTEKSLVPEEALLEDIDCLIYDIQDVGCRYYTYLNTMILIMKELSGSSVRLIVLDRPNPLGGSIVEGPDLKSDYESFCGVISVPVRHGFTAGEMALFASEHLDLDLEIQIVPVEGWNRDELFSVPQWIFPSPNMPSLGTALVYPGMCLLEGMNISEGRGTTKPFEICGAPFVEGNLLSKELNSLNLPGVVFRPEAFIPTFNKFSGMVNQGVYIHVTDQNSYLPFKTAIALIMILSQLCEDTDFIKGVYEFNTRHYAFDLLAGSDLLRTMIIDGAQVEDLENTWLPFQKNFQIIKEEYHLY